MSAFISRQIVGFIVKKTAYQFGVKTTQELRLIVMKSIFSLGPRFTKDEGTGNLVTLIITGLQKLRAYLELFLPKLAALSVTLLASARFRLVPRSAFRHYFTCNHANFNFIYDFAWIGCTKK